MSNKKKSDQLGMNFGTASSRLRKYILFSLIVETGKDVCYQCGEKIESANDFSIEHKIKWQDSEDPKGLFFDLDNISFSHLKCNVADSRVVLCPVGISGERYVHYDKSPRNKKKWRVKVKGVKIGRFITKEKAIIARDNYLNSSRVS